jgi:predicted O-methyltransferase YrrM
MPVQRYSNLVKQVNLCKPKTIVEVGTWNGVNASKMIQAAQSHNSGITYYGFDIFESIDEQTRLKEHHTKRIMTETNVRNTLKTTGATVKLHIGYTDHTLPKFEPDLPLDFIYIDGGHSLETIDNDWTHLEKHMHAGTVVLFDDYYEDDNTAGCFLLMNNLRATGKYDIKVLSVDEVKSKPGSRQKKDLRIGMVKLTRR